MAFIKSFTIESYKNNPFPFCINAIKFAQNIEFSKVTVIMGQNGSGKSSLMEVLALRLELPLINGGTTYDDTFEAARIIQPYVKIKLNKLFRNGFFFRAEDFSDYVAAVQKQKNKLYKEFQSHGLKEHVIKQMSESHNFALHRMRNDFGENLQTLSHGEACMMILNTKIAENELILLDEPEIGLHPSYQKHLVKLITQKSESDNAQFIISTHSPIIASMPNITLYNIQDNGIHRVKYQDTDHYRILSETLNYPFQNDDLANLSNKSSTP
jgi:predicted ATPase